MKKRTVAYSARSVSKLLYILVEAFSKLGGQEYAENIWQDAEETTHAIQPFVERAEALIALGTVLYNEQALQEANILWNEVDTTVRTIEKERKSTQIMVDLCIALTQAQYWNWMRGTWRYVKEMLASVENNWLNEVNLEEIDPIILDQALIILSMALIKDQQWDLVSEVAQFIANPQEQANILQLLGFAICKTQRSDLAKTIWNKVGDVSALSKEDEEGVYTFANIYFDWTSQVKAIVLIELGSQLYKAQQYKHAKKIWREVEALIIIERDDWLKADLARNLGIALAQCKQWRWAEAVAHGILAPWAKTEVLIELSLQFYNAQYPASAKRSWREAEKNIRMIKEYLMQTKALQLLGATLLMLGEEKYAEEIWNQAETAIQMISDGQVQDEALDIFTNILAQRQQWEQAQKIAYKIEISAYKAKTLIELGAFLAQAKLWKRAEAVWKEAKKQAYAIQDCSKSLINIIKLSTVLVQMGYLEPAKSLCNEKEASHQ